MPQNSTPAARPAKQTAFVKFAAAVAAFSVTFGVIAVAHKVGRCYFAAYDGPNGRIHTEASPKWPNAVYRLEKAAMEDMVYELN